MPRLNQKLLFTGLALALSCYGLTELSASAQEGARYADERMTGDLKAQKYRSALVQATQKVVAEQYSKTLKELQNELGAHLTMVFQSRPPHVEINPRMISKYGVGHESASDAVPGAARRMVELHTLLRASAICNCIPKRLQTILTAAQAGGISIDPEKIILASRNLGTVEGYFLDYWGYNNQIRQKPELDSELWTYALRYHNIGSSIADPKDQTYFDLLEALVADKEPSLADRIEAQVKELWSSP